MTTSRTPSFTLEASSLLDLPIYCIGPITGPMPTLTKPAGAAPLFAVQKALAAAACALTDAMAAALWFRGTTTVAQQWALLPAVSVGECTRPLRIIVLSRKPGKMLLYHP
jgi:hypothetical protein